MTIYHITHVRWVRPAIRRSEVVLRLSLRSLLLHRLPAQPLAAAHGGVPAAGGAARRAPSADPSCAQLSNL